MLLPQAFHHASGARSIVAAVKDSNHIIAAAAISPRLRSDPLPGPRIVLHVIPPFRRRGIARQLLAACAAAAASEGASALYAWEPLAAESAAAAAYTRLGFNHTVIVHEGRADVPRGYVYIKPFYDQIVERNWIPPHAKLIPLHSVHAQDIARLHVAHLGGRFTDLLSAIRGESILRYHPALSPVLLMDGRVMGFTLAQFLPGAIARVDATVVHPTLRGGWANLWLKFAGATACLQLGIHTLLYYTYDRHTDTRKLARQVGTITREMVEPYLILQTPRSAAAPPPGMPGDQNPAPP